MAQTVEDEIGAGPEAKDRSASHADYWVEYQQVLRYVGRYGKEHPPTARLILLTCIGHEADTYQIWYDTGACLYSINENLAELTRQGILIRTMRTAGRFKTCRYRIAQDVLAAKMSPFDDKFERRNNG
jgi:hypothetical protein